MESLACPSSAARPRHCPAQPPSLPGRCRWSAAGAPQPAALRYALRMTPHDQQRFGRVTLVGLIIAIFGVAFMFGGPVISAMLLLLAWVLIMLDEDMKSG